MIIPTRIVTAPTVEPVELSDVKTHLRGPSSDHDALISGLIKSAREEIENRTGRALVQRTVAAMFQRWPREAFELPFAPLQSVTSVKYTDTAGSEYTFSTENYSVDTDSEPGRVVLGHSKSWPTATLHAPDYPIEVTYVAGYAPTSGETPDYRANIPQNLKIAIMFLVDMAYNRPPDETALNRAIDSLLTPYRIWAL